MKKRFLILIFICIAIISFPALRIDENFQNAYRELQELFKIAPRYYLRIDENQAQPMTVDNDRFYMIILPGSISMETARHEMAHVFFFELCKLNGLSPEDFPIWYHELVASWFQVLGGRDIKLLPLKSIFFDFFACVDEYPSLEDTKAFYLSIRSFALFLDKRFDFKNFVLNTLNVAKRTGFSGVKLFNEDPKILLRKWRFWKLLPYLLYTLLVILLVYIVSGRRDDRWRGSELGETGEKEVIENKEFQDYDHPED
ncbi:MULTISPECIES: hypothetical protein [Kosmotoga]|jgi:hypothetical protein|uniref:Peptidase MA-like domain-containing protein n=1 Tax=Kosmotoga olearia (strain ATCC BAA-1733 / DSM 21960 / TBF 19.5.1) TaxID=521045 RepID=C5CEC9_KOSOT|nr:MULTISPECIES: hypothetical protein [Kosmotoga]ACR80169.1 hypothetical protein Kole_1477 [Kosmotoga olearia TBF 19.5.1]MDI3523832.1 hypothetical protein [Kosmotoga sp.]MDK2953244.1 hypothetical protein [Kosmotoga sp.]OAA20356.1 hypothetical protein DU53_08155 [Kosmotoga sp. DU53]